MNKHQKMIVSITKKELRQNIIEKNYDVICLGFRARRCCARQVFKGDSIGFLSGYKKETYKI